jgi:hypothetical protein
MEAVFWDVEKLAEVEEYILVQQYLEDRRAKEAGFQLSQFV